YFLPQYRDLRMLAAQAEHRRARHIGMMNITRYQSAKGSGILASSAAPHLMSQKAYAVQIREQRRGGFERQSLGKLVFPDLVYLTFTVEPRHLGQVAAIGLRRSNAEFTRKGFLKNSYISVFTKYQRNYQPVVARTHLSIGPVIAQKAPVFPLRYVWSLPCIFASLPLEAGAAVANVRGAERLTSTNWRCRLPHENVVHDDGVIWPQIREGKLVLSRHTGSEPISDSLENNFLSRWQIDQRDRNVIVGANSQRPAAKLFQIGHQFCTGVASRSAKPAFAPRNAYAATKTYAASGTR